MTGMVCSCSSPDCMVNGCALIRQQQQTYQGTTPAVGWTCPNCNAGVAPHLGTCPHCCPVQTRVVIQTPNFENDGENHERSKDYQITKEEDQG